MNQEKNCNNCDLFINSKSSRNTYCSSCFNFNKWRPHTIHSEIMKQLGPGNWYRIFNYEMNNGQHWGYTDPVSRVFRSQFENVKKINNIYYGTLEQ